MYTTQDLQKSQQLLLLSTWLERKKKGFEHRHFDTIYHFLDYVLFFLSFDFGAFLILLLVRPALPTVLLIETGIPLAYP